MVKIICMLLIKVTLYQRAKHIDAGSTNYKNLCRPRMRSGALKSIINAI